MNSNKFTIGSQYTGINTRSLQRVARIPPWDDVVPYFMGDFDSMLASALQKAATTKASTEAQANAFSAGMEEGRSAGLAEGISSGAEKGVKAMMTVGAPQMFVSGDLIIPFNKNEELYNNPQSRDIIGNWIESMDVGVQKSEDHLKTILKRPGLTDEIKTLKSEINDRMSRLFPNEKEGTPTKKKQNNIQRRIDSLQNLIDKGNTGYEEKLNEAVELQSTIKKLQSINPNHAKDKLETARRMVLHDKDGNLIMSRMKAEFVKHKTASTPALLTDTFNIYNTPKLQALNKGKEGDIITRIEKIAAGGIDPAWGIIDKRKVSGDVSGLSDIISIPSSVGNMTIPKKRSNIPKFSLDDGMISQKSAYS